MADSGATAPVGKGVERLVRAVELVLAANVNGDRPAAITALVTAAEPLTRHADTDASAAALSAYLVALVAGNITDDDPAGHVAWLAVGVDSSFFPKVEIASLREDETAPSEDLATVLDATVEFVSRFMAMTLAQLDAVALWAAHTHAVDAFDVVAYLFVTSAEKRSGKTLLLDLLDRLVLRGRSTTNISPAALYRMIAEHRP